MPLALLRRALSLTLIATLAIAPAACRDKNAGTVKVIVIGGAPKIRDPALGPLSSPDAVLLASVGQRLVRFDAAGNIVGGLSGRRNVSDHRLSYIFRISALSGAGGGQLPAQ